MLSGHIKNSVSETPAAVLVRPCRTEDVFAKLNKINPSFVELEPIVEGMSAKGQKRTIVQIVDFLKATESYRATMKRLGLDDSPQAA